MTAQGIEASTQVVALYQRLLEAWNRRDAAGFADLFAEEGNCVGFDGSPMDGRKDIAAQLRPIFDSHPTAAYVAKVREVRPLDAAVTLLRAVVGMVPPGANELNPATNAIQSLVVVAQAGQPKIALLHNTPAAFHGRPQLVEALTRELTEVLRSGRVVAT
jgi:uncharacterized protein (TIGR02246 family)